MPSFQPIQPGTSDTSMSGSSMAARRSVGPARYALRTLSHTLVLRTPPAWIRMVWRPDPRSCLTRAYKASAA